MTIKYDNNFLNRSCVLDIPHFEGTGTDFHDVSKQHNHGSAIGAGWSKLATDVWTSTYGGDADRIIFPLVSIVSGKCTVLVWWKRAGDSGGPSSSTYHTLFTAINGYSSNGVLVNKAGTELRCTLRIDGADVTVTMPCSASAWNLVGLVWDAANLYPVVNGVKGIPAAAVGALSADANFTMSGRYTTANYYYANGSMYRHRILDDALNDTELMMIFNAEKGRFEL